MIVYPAIDLSNGRCVQWVGGRPETERVSLPDPDAYLSWTVTDARTAPDLQTYPLNFTRLGCVTTPSLMFTEKL